MGANQYLANQARLSGDNLTELRLLNRKGYETIVVSTCMPIILNIISLRSCQTLGKKW